MIYIQKLLTALFFLFPILAISQNQANNWYFSPREGLDFNSGYPVIIDKSIDYMLNSTCLSDTTGKLLFYTDGNTVWNTDLDTLQNGFGLFAGNNNQPAVIVPNPGNSNQYYIFTVGGEDLVIGLRYSIIDISLDNGKGAVTSKNILVDEGVWARHRVAAVRHSNNRDFWIITRTKDNNNIQSWAVFLLTPTGLDPVPVISYAPNMTLFNIAIDGEIKVSQDRKKMISLHSSNANHHGALDISSFNASTGQIIHHFMISEYYSYGSSRGMYGMEISPDSKLVYCTVSSDTNYSLLYQYDLTKIDSAQFVNSGIVIDTCYTKRLQLAPDGKIYGDHLQGNSDRFLDIIHDVWARDSECSLVKNAIFLGPEVLQNHRVMLPTFMSELLYRFVWQGGPCAKTPFTFRHRFIPEPDSIIWSFGDGTTSVDFNPTHVFQSGGNYEVHAHVVYPDGRIEETSREVEVLAAPEPWLGNDTLMCAATTLQLDAGNGFTQYVWNQQFPPGNQYYTVTDTGFYSVRVRNDLNCYGSDTIHIGLYPPVFLDISNVQISNTTCGNSTGAIRGIQVSPAATVEWHDGNGNLVGTEIEISGLPAGNYFLTLNDTTGCITQVPTPFNVINSDAYLIIESADGNNATCGLSNGSIEVQTSVFSDLLLFSSDGGNTWYDNQGIFDNLPPGEYMIWAKDAQGCEAIYNNNPVWVNNSGGPVVTFIGSTNATGANANGTISVTATGDSLYYQLNGGAAQDSGYFEALAPDVYDVTITDKYGCDTTLTITVTSETGYQLSALAGKDRQCMYKMATSVLKVSNLNGVKDFKATVQFNSLLMDCIGYDELFHPALVVTEFPNRVELEWHGASPLALNDTTTLANLVFETRQTGLAEVHWDIPGSSYFKDENGNNIPCAPIDGEVIISDPPVLVTNGDKSLCEGDFTVISGDVFLGVPPYVLEWTKPDGSTTNDTPIWLFDLGADQSGNYIISVSDDYGCNVKDTVTLNVVPLPTANFPESPIPFENQYTLEARQGYASYEWSNGETNYFITVTEEGEYSVIIKTTEGCTNLEKVTLIDTWFPFNIPNAFTPNGDGLNDSFRPVTDYDRFSRFSMIIYNSWGQRQFETTNPAEGWDGKDAAAGVYVWVITYVDYLGKVNTLRGSVTLIK
jgi:gliding motility-associated-like protein